MRSNLAPSDASRFSVLRGNRATMRWLIGGVVLGGIWLVLDRTILEHKRRCRASDSLRQRIAMLVLATPSEPSDNEWAAAVQWTAGNLHSNSLVAFEASLTEIVQLESDLVERMQSEVGMDTIDWLWDRYAELTDHGHRYRAKFRVAMLESMEDAGEYGDVYGEYASLRRWTLSDLRQRSDRADMPPFVLKALRADQEHPQE